MLGNVEEIDGNYRGEEGDIAILKSNIDKCKNWHKYYTLIFNNGWNNFDQSSLHQQNIGLRAV